MDQQRQSEILKFDQKYAAGIRRRFSRMGFALAIMVLAGNAASILIHALVSKFAPGIIDTNWYAWTLSAVCVYLISVPIMFLCAGRDKTAEPPRQNKLKLGHFMIILLMCFGIMYLGNYIGTYLMMMISGIKGEAIANPIETAITGSNIWVNLVISVIVAPIVEELVFRKLMIDRLGGFGEKTVIVFSALMFGLFHTNLYQFFYAFGVGLLFGYVYVRTGKIRYSIILHMVINLFGGVISALILGLLDQELLLEMVEIMSDNAAMQALMDDPAAYAAFVEKFMSVLPGFLVYAGYAMLMAGVSIAGLVLLLVKFRRFVVRPAPFELPRERVGNTVYFNPGVMVAIFACTALTVLVMIM